MTTSSRQNNLILNEDWTRIYQTFKNADFKSYDFENIRRVIIEYIRENYPEDFNDYIESSEYMALIDAIAFMGQSLSFRIDLEISPSKLLFGMTQLILTGANSF